MCGCWSQRPRAASTWCVTQLSGSATGWPKASKMLNSTAQRKALPWQPRGSSLTAAGRNVAQPDHAAANPGSRRQAVPRAGWRPIDPGPPRGVLTGHVGTGHAFAPADAAIGQAAADQQIDAVAAGGRGVFDLPLQRDMDDQGRKFDNPHTAIRTSDPSANFVARRASLLPV